MTSTRGVRSGAIITQVSGSFVSPLLQVFVGSSSTVDDCVCASHANGVLRLSVLFVFSNVFCCSSGSGGVISGSGGISAKITAWVGRLPAQIDASSPGCFSWIPLALFRMAGCDARTPLRVACIHLFIIVGSVCWDKFFRALHQDFLVGVTPNALWPGISMAVFAIVGGIARVFIHISDAHWGLC